MTANLQKPSMLPAPVNRSPQARKEDPSMQVPRFQFAARSRAFVLFVLLLQLALPAHGRCQEPSVESVLADWKVRQHQVKSLKCILAGKGLLLKGQFTGERGLPEELTGKTVPESDSSYEIKLTWLFDCAGNRVRKEMWDSSFRIDLGRLIPRHSVHIYNGSTTKRYFPKDTNSARSYGDHTPELGIVQNGNTITYTVVDYPLFVLLGAACPSEVLLGATGPEKVRTPLDPQKVELVGKRLLQGKECLVVRLLGSERGTFDEIWVSPERASLPLRVETYDNFRMSSRSEVSYSPEKDWPSGWTTSEYQDGRLTGSSTLLVKELSVNPDLTAEDFDIELRPGMVVRKADAKADKRKNYNTKDYVLAADGRTFVELAPGSRGSRWLVVAGFLGVALVLVLGVYLWRKRQAQKTPEAP
jgi:hypothetical protein